MELHHRFTLVPGMPAMVAAVAAALTTITPVVMQGAPPARWLTTNLSALFQAPCRSVMRVLSCRLTLAGTSGVKLCF